MKWLIEIKSSKFEKNFRAAKSNNNYATFEIEDKISSY